MTVLKSLHPDAEDDDCYVVDIIERKQKSEVIELKTTQAEGEDESLVASDLDRQNFSGSVERYRSRSFRRNLKLPRKLSFRHFQNEEIDTQEVCLQSENSNKTEYNRSNSFLKMSGENGRIIKIKSLRLENVADESSINRCGTEENKNNILDQRQESQDIECEKHHPSSPKCNSNQLSNSSNEASEDTNSTPSPVKRIQSFSVGDSKVPKLLSKRVRFASKTHMVVNSTMTYQGGSEEDSPELQSQKVEELVKFSFINQEYTMQTAKAIVSCKNSKDFLFTPLHVQLEKLLLISNLRNKAATNEFEKLRYNSICKFNSHTGSVFVKNIAFPGIGPEESQKLATWYVCTVSCGTEIFGTAASLGNANGDVIFKEEFEIKTRSINFAITVTLYGMMVPINNKMNSTLLCFNPARIRHSYSSSRALTKTRSTSLFIPYDQTIISIHDIKETEFRLPELSKRCKLLGSLNASFRAEPNFSESEGVKSFLNIGKVSDRGIFWDRLWCCLKGKHVKLYTYPNNEDDDPDNDKYLEVLELDMCTTSAVKVERPRTLLVQILDKSGEGPVVKRILLSADFVLETEIWLKCINNVFNKLKSWECLRS